MPYVRNKTKAFRERETKKKRLTTADWGVIVVALILLIYLTKKILDVLN